MRPTLGDGRNLVVVAAITITRARPGGTRAGGSMNTFELELLDRCDEAATSEAVVGFVRQQRRMPDYEELVAALSILVTAETR